MGEVCEHRALFVVRGRLQCVDCQRDVRELILELRVQLAEAVRGRDEAMQMVTTCRKFWEQTTTVPFDEEIAFLEGRGPDPDPTAKKLATAVAALEWYAGRTGITRPDVAEKALAAIRAGEAECTCPGAPRMGRIDLDVDPACPQHGKAREGSGT